MTAPDEALSAIDAALEGWTERDWSVGADAMRWTPTPNPSPQSERPSIRHRADAGTVTLTVTPDAQALVAVVERIVLQWAGIRNAFMATAIALRKHQVSIHIVYAPVMYGDGYRRHRRRCRCRACNPAGNPKPLRVDGREYARRRKNRRRRAR